MPAHRARAPSTSYSEANCLQLVCPRQTLPASLWPLRGLLDETINYMVHVGRFTLQAAASVSVEVSPVGPPRARGRAEVS